MTFEGRTATDRDEKWRAAESKNFKAQFMKGIRTKSDQFLCLEIIKVIESGFDRIIVGGYSTPTAILAIEYMRLHKTPFWIEADGGLISQDSPLKYRVKRHFISAASGWLSSGKMTTKYLVHYGADESKVHVYPFSSLREQDILKQVPSTEEKMIMRQKLKLRGKIILSVGRFSYLGGYGKGFDILLKAMQVCTEGYTLCIVGDEPTQEFVEMKNNMKLDNVVFVGFKTKEELKDYYIAADVFCLQTRGDVWGLVVNEAMAYGLPVITTDKCVAGMELIEDDKNGYVIPVEDYELLAEKIMKIGGNKQLQRNMSCYALQTVKSYTIEKMTLVHKKLLGESA